VPAGTCIPSQLHGIIDLHAMNAHCCSGVNGLGPAHGGVPGAPQIGSADAAGALANVAVAIASAMAAMNAVTNRRVRSTANSNLSAPAQIVTLRYRYGLVPITRNQRGMSDGAGGQSPRLDLFHESMHFPPD
jgi:hypothetical protein